MPISPSPPPAPISTMPPARLRWACRRGMLELDLMLPIFLEKRYMVLSEQDKQLFERLLECQDAELFAWLMGHESSDDAELQTMVEMIRHHVKV